MIEVRCLSLMKSTFVLQYIERCAIQISRKDIIRFFNELKAIDWTHATLTFLDEVSFDNRGMLRRRGYALKVQDVDDQMQCCEISAQPGQVTQFSSRIFHFSRKQQYLLHKQNATQQSLRGGELAVATVGASQLPSGTCCCQDNRAEYLAERFPFRQVESSLRVED
uniref:Uncharacterized protein n=1 Tax=Spongospora subterranea TaxID=70186 RepID=A0A0H5QNQ0_9EUKA|eukprot:CRZ03217.1 hypothetical protein [Spongospora subterranea]